MPTSPPRYEAYCDESRPELFVSAGTTTGRALIGSLWMPADFRREFKSAISDLRKEYGTWGEMKWKKVSPASLPFYSAAVNYFFSRPELRFRVIVVDAAQLNLERFHDSNPELGFYKFYFQLLTHWIDQGNDYAVFCDDKVNRDRKRLPQLHKVLGNANRGARITSVQAVDSHQVVAIQLCDLLMGATQWRANGSSGTSHAKATLVSEVEHHLGHRLGPTLPSERKFNIFEIRLRGGGK